MPVSRDERRVAKIVAPSLAKRQRHHRLQMEDQPILLDRLANSINGIARFDRSGWCGGNDLQMAGFTPALALARFLELGDRFGDLPDDGAKDRDIGLDNVETFAGIFADQRTNALAEHGASLCVGSEQAR